MQNKDSTFCNSLVGRWKVTFFCPAFSRKFEGYVHAAWFTKKHREGFPVFFIFCP